MGHPGLIPKREYRAIASTLAKERAAFPERTVQGLFYRALPGEFIHNFTENGPSFHNEEARYNIPGSFSALYLADTPETAIEEARPIDPTDGRGALPLVMAAFQVKSTRIRDLTSESDLRGLDLGMDDLRKDRLSDHGHLLPRSLALYCRKKLNAFGLLTRSAKCEGNNLVLFPDRIILDSVLRLQTVSRVRRAHS